MIKQAFHIVQFLAHQYNSSASKMQECRFILLAIWSVSLSLIIGTHFASARRLPTSVGTDVTEYGAIGDGAVDDSRAFHRAWRHVCEAAQGKPVYKIPARKTFLLKPMRFQGPCKASSIHIQILGKVVAPRSIDGWMRCRENSWLVFSNIQGLTITGSGQFDGQGSIWWNKYFQPPRRCTQPTALHFERCSGLHLNGTRHLNSPRNHISLTYCQNAELSHLRITAPMHSPNTDGIDVSLSSQIKIRDSLIRTGDDCVAVNHNSSNVNITNTICGPGHGISIGSLGSSNFFETVEDVLVKNCTFKTALNGARIKTWEGGSGFARRIVFEDIILENTWNPIIINQHYCGNRHHCRSKASAVRISDVTFRNVRGTTRTSTAINLSCSRSLGCSNLAFDSIDIAVSVPGRTLHSHCENAHGWFYSSSPHVSCLRN